MSESRAPALRNRHPPARAKRHRRDLEPHGCLLALVLSNVDHVDNPLNDRAVDAGFVDDVSRILVPLDIAFDDLVEDFIRRERVLVSLVRPELGAGGLGDAALGDRGL